MNEILVPLLVFAAPAIALWLTIKKTREERKNGEYDGDPLRAQFLFVWYFAVYCAMAFFMGLIILVSLFKS